MKQTSIRGSKPLSSIRLKKGSIQPGSSAARTKRQERQPVMIHAGFHRGKDKLATITQVLDPRVPTRTIGELSIPEQVRLISARLRREKHFVPLHVLGVEGVIDRKRALREIQSLSSLGLHLLEIEKQYLKIQLEREVM